MVNHGAPLAVGHVIRYDIYNDLRGVDPVSVEIVGGYSMTAARALTPIHPGAHLAQSRRGVVAPANPITGTLNAQRPNHFFGVDLELRLTRRAKYALRVSERKHHPALRKLSTMSDRKPSGRPRSGLFAPVEAS